jgi:5,10-methylenetetrahydromethanopterin reductase
MTKLGIGLPAVSIANVRASAEAVAAAPYDSFSVYGDLGDLPPYAALHAVADRLQGSEVGYVGPMGVAVGMMDSEQIAVHAAALEEQLPGQSSIGLVRGAFLESIGRKPASLATMEDSVQAVRDRLDERGLSVPIYLGGFGPKVLAMAGRLGVDGIKLGGSTNPLLAERARHIVGNPEVDVVLGAVSVIDRNRKVARELARREVAKYLAVVGRLDATLEGDDVESLEQFTERFEAGMDNAPDVISDSLLDKFALAGTPEDALQAIKNMEGRVNRFEFGTPHGLSDRPTNISYIADTVLEQL